MVSAALAFAVLAVPLCPAENSDAPDTIYRNGIGSFSSGNYADAAKAFQDLIDRFGKEPSLSVEMESIYYALGCSKYNLGNYADAITTFEDFLKRYPTARVGDEVLFRIGVAYQAEQSIDKAVAAYRRLLEQSPNSSFAEDGAFQIGACYLVGSQYAKSAEAFGSFLAAFPDSELAAQAMMYQARAYYENGDLLKAVQVLEALDRRGQKPDHLAYSNFLTVEIGDAAFDNTDYDLALRAYRRVRTKQAILRIQQNLVQDLERRSQALAKQPVDPQNITARFRQERRLQLLLGQSKDLLQKLQDVPDYDAALFHRIGRCFFNTDRYWEARIAFTRVVAQATDEKIREAAQFDLILVLSRMRQFEDLISEADKYLANYE
jgi:TolA-binding protein